MPSFHSEADLSILVGAQPVAGILTRNFAMEQEKAHSAGELATGPVRLDGLGTFPMGSEMQWKPHG